MPENLHLGFLTLRETQKKDGYIGAILVTNSAGIPVEFRCTHPVRPTQVQRVLHGGSLEPTIGVELCGEPLIKAVQTKPQVILVDKSLLLDVRLGIDLPVFYVRRAGEVLEIGTEPSARQFASATGRFQPINADPHPNYRQDVQEVGELLQVACDQLDLSEPFDRIAKALEVLAQLNPGIYG